MSERSPSCSPNGHEVRAQNAKQAVSSSLEITSSPPSSSSPTGSSCFSQRSGGACGGTGWAMLVT